MLLQLRGVSKTYRVKDAYVPALRDVDLEIAEGKLTAVLGPSGSGKSTLLRVLAGFERPEAGTIGIAGPAGPITLVGPGRFVRPERRGIGIVAQDGALFPHLDVAANIAFGIAGRRGWPVVGRRGGASRERVAELLEMVGLPGYEGRAVDELSGGEQQRVALARALAPRPRVVLLDEPFSAIDAALRAELGVQVRDLLRRLGITSVLVTHDQAEALSLADRVVVMREGRIAQAGTPREVYEQPADAATARFVGDAMVLPGEVVTPTEVRCLLGLLRAEPFAGDQIPPAGSRCQVVLRPESLAIAAAGSAGLPARVVSAEYYGHDAMLTVALPATGALANGTAVSGPAVNGTAVSGTASGGCTVRVRTHGPAVSDPAALLGHPVSLQVRGPALVLR